LFTSIIKKAWEGESPVIRNSSSAMRVITRERELAVK
jgi:hypothetical protein